MRAAGAVLAVVAIGPIAAIACGGDATGTGVRSPEAASASASGSASASASATTSGSSLPVATAVATAAPAADASPAAQWIKSVPIRPVTAKVDELVWAAVPTNNEVRLGVYRVLAVSGNTAALQDLLRVRWEKVPGALVIPIGDPARLRVDMVVTYADWRGFVGVGQILKTSPKIRVTFRDASAVVREETVNVAEPLVGTLDRLQYVAFSKPGDDTTLHKGLVFAVDGDNLFIRDDANHAWVVPKSRVSPLKFPAKRLKVGDAVRAYTQEKGYRPGVIQKIYLPGLSYGVTADDDTRIYFFSDLAIQPAQ